MHIIDSCITQQAQVFEKLFVEAQASWPPAPSVPSLDKQCFTLVMRPSEKSRIALAEQLDYLAERFGGNVYYGPENLHVTVFAAPDLDGNNLVARHFDRYLSSHICALKPFTMPVGGLSVINDTIVFKAYDPSGNLLQFNKSALIELTEELYGEGVDIDKMIGLHSKIFWLTAVRLGSDAPRELLNYVVTQADQSMGALYFDTMELVKTDLLFRPENTIVVKKYSLGELN